MTPGLQKKLQKVQQALPQMVHHMREQEMRVISEAKLSISEYYCLMYLEHSDLMMRELSEKLSLALSTITGLVDSLEKRNLAKRKLDLTDRRSWRVELTTEGRNLVRKIISDKERLMVSIFSTFTKEEIDWLIRIIEKLSEGMQKALQRR